MNSEVNYDENIELNSDVLLSDINNYTSEEISKDFSYANLAKDIAFMKNIGAIQDSLHKLSYNNLCDLAPIILNLKKLYINEIKKVDIEKQKYIKDSKFINIMIEIDKTINWCEAMAECGIIYEKLDNVILNFRDFEMFTHKIKNGNITLDINETKKNLQYLNYFETNFHALSLLSSYYRGCYYNTLKKKFSLTNVQISEKFFLNRKTIERYIQLYNIIVKYPLLLKCKISTYDLITYSSKIDSYISNNDHLNSKYKKKITNIVIIFKEIHQETKENITYNIHL